MSPTGRRIRAPSTACPAEMLPAARPYLQGPRTERADPEGLGNGESPRSGLRPGLAVQRWLWRLVELDLLVGRMPRWAECPGWYRRRERGVVSGRRLVGVLDSAQPSSDAGLASGDDLAVTAAVGAIGPVGTGPLDLTGVGLALAGVRGDGEHGDVSRSGV